MIITACRRRNDALFLNKELRVTEGRNIPHSTIKDEVGRKGRMLAMVMQNLMLCKNRVGAHNTYQCTICILSCRMTKR